MQITSTRVETRGGHDHVTLWADGQNIGTLRVDAGRGRELLEQLGCADRWRGHLTERRGNVWVYSDTGQPVPDNVERECGACGLAQTAEGHDACLGTLPGVMNACCGHGGPRDAYVQFDDLRWFGGADALEWFRSAGRGPKLPEPG